MKTVSEVSRITGVSIRTLHYYDAIGLLTPSDVTESGYRLYDATALERLQAILLFKELEFSLDDIKKIIDSPDFDRNEAIEMQIKLLEMKRDRISELISFAREIKIKGADKMSFNAFDKSKIEEYTAAARKKWGETDAFREFDEKNKGKTDARIKMESDGLMDIFRRFGEIKNSSPESDKSQSLVNELQKYITDHYYNCTDEILSALGMMYSAEGEMKDNINNTGGAGTADFVAEAIKFCMQKK